MKERIKEENIQHFKTIHVSSFFFFVAGHFAPLGTDPDPDPTDQKQADPDGSVSTALVSQHLKKNIILLTVVSCTCFFIL
jgi:hypothetical protein